MSYGSMSGAVNQDVPSCTNVYAPNGSLGAGAVVTVDGTGGSAVTAAGDNTYYDTFLPPTNGLASLSAFISVVPASGATGDAKITFSGNQSLFVSPSDTAHMDGILIRVPSSATVNAAVALDSANFSVNVGSNGADGVNIDAQGSKSATMTLNNSALNVDVGGSYGIQLNGANAALTSVGTQNTLTIGTVTAPSQSAVYMFGGATMDFAGLLTFNSSLSGITIGDNSVLVLDGSDPARSTINVNGASSRYALGLNYTSTDTTGALKNLTVNLTANNGVGGKGAEGFNINMTHGALALQNVRLTSDMIDGSALTLSGGSVTSSALAVDVTGKGTGGIDVEPNTNGQITLDGTVGLNTIVTRGAADLPPTTFTDLPYANAGAVRLLGGSINLSSADIETYGTGAPGIYLSAGAIATGANVSVHTHADGASAAVYTPFSGNVGNLTTGFSSTTSLRTDGANAYGFVADGLDLYDGTQTPHPFSLSFGALGLSSAAISVQGVGSAAIGARNGATLILDGQDLSALAALPSGTYAVEAEAGGTVRFAQGAAAGGASLLAGAGGTLDFNDSTATASGSVVTVNQGSSASTRGELDLSGRTRSLAVGALNSSGSGGTNGLVNIGGNSLVLDGGVGTSGTFSGAVEGAGSLIKSGAGLQILAGQNAFDYTGATQVNGGTLAVANGVAGQDANGPKLFELGAAGTLSIGNNQGSFALGAIAGSGTVHLTDGGTNASSNLIIEGTAAPQLFSGAIDGSGGVIVRGGAGTVQTFSGSGVFGFTGDVTLGSGTLAVAGQAVSSNRFVFDDGANTGGTLDISANGPGGFTLGGIQAANPGTTAQIKLGNTSGAAANLVLAGAGNYTYSGTISGYGDVVKQGSGTQTMSGVNPFGFTGTTVIANGVLQLRNIADPSQFDHTFQLDGGWLDLSDRTFDSTGVNVNDWTMLHVTDGSHAASGGIIGGDDKITLGGNAGATVEAAQIDGGVFVVKTGSNTTTLTGANRYVGNTRILAGALKVSDDSNLGSTQYEREVVLDGGNLEIGGGGTFTSSRQLQLQVAGAVQVDGTASTLATLGSIAGSGQMLTKAGPGALTFTSGGVLGQAVVTDGLLDLRAAKVDATTLSTSGQPAIVQGPGTTVDLNGATLVSQGDAVVASGTSTLNLSGNTQVTTGGATYRVTSGTGTLNASGQSLIGNVLAADGAGSALALHLSDNSTFTGTPALTNGATATVAIDGSSSWNMTADTTLNGLTNLGSITMGASLPTAAVAKASQSAAYRALTVSGNYQGGGAIDMRTELNVGGALANQYTDRLLVTGNIAGQTQLSLTTSGAGANTNTALNDQAIPTEGISLVQVGGSASANAFTLKGGYVAAAGSPYQYRIFAYGPGSYAPPAASQSVLPNGEPTQWDYRLQTSYTDSSGRVQPGTPTGGHPTLVPQASSYLTAPLALQNYESIVADNLYRRLGDVRHGAFDPAVKVDDVFARTIDSRSVYHSSRGFADYGYDFGQSITALQFGADWLHRRSADRDFRLGTAVTLGDSTVRPQAADVESSKASISTFNVAFTGTWQRRDGWYADGLLSAGWYRGNVDTSQRGEVGRVNASGFDSSIEVGRSFTLPIWPGGIEIEPHARVLAQLLHFEDRKDNDGVAVGTSDLFALTGLLGVRMSMLVPGTASFRPYVRVDFSNTWMNSPSVTMSGQTFDVARPGGAVQIGVGATGLLAPNLSLYGELSGAQRLGPGMSTVAATLGLRYTF